MAAFDKLCCAVTTVFENYINAPNDDASILAVVDALYALGNELESESSSSKQHLIDDYNKTQAAPTSSALTQIVLFLAKPESKFQEYLHLPILSKYKEYPSHKKNALAKLSPIASPLISAIAFYSKHLKPEANKLENINIENQPLTTIAQAFIREKYKQAVLDEYSADCEEYYEYLKQSVTENSKLVVEGDFCQASKEVLEKNADINNAKNAWEESKKTRIAFENVFENKLKEVPANIVLDDLEKEKKIAEINCASYDKEKGTVDEIIKTLKEESNVLAMQNLESVVNVGNATASYALTSKEYQDSQTARETCKKNHAASINKYTETVKLNHDYNLKINLLERKKQTITSNQEKTLESLTIFEQEKNTARASVEATIVRCQQAEKNRQLCQQTLDDRKAVLTQKRLFFSGSSDTLAELEQNTKKQWKEYLEKKEKYESTIARVKAYHVSKVEGEEPKAKPEGLWAVFNGLTPIFISEETKRKQEETRKIQSTLDLTSIDEQEKAEKEQLTVLEAARDKENIFRARLEQMKMAETLQKEASDDCDTAIADENQANSQLKEARALVLEKDGLIQEHKSKLDELELKLNKLNSNYKTAVENLNNCKAQLKKTHRDMELDKAKSEKAEETVKDLQARQLKEFQILDGLKLSLEQAQKLYEENEIKLNEAVVKSKNLGEKIKNDIENCKVKESNYKEAELHKSACQKNLELITNLLTEAKTTEVRARNNYIETFKNKDESTGILWEKFEQIVKLKKALKPDAETKTDAKILNSCQAAKEALPIFQQERDSATKKFFKGFAIFLGCLVGVTEIAVGWSLATKQCLWSWTSPRENLSANTEKLDMLSHLVIPQSQSSPLPTVPSPVLAY